jgi:hypothetical protein
MSPTWRFFSGDADRENRDPGTLFFRGALALGCGSRVTLPRCFPTTLGRPRQVGDNEAGMRIQLAGPHSTLATTRRGLFQLCA